MCWWCRTGLARLAIASAAVVVLLAPGGAHAAENSFSGTCLSLGAMRLSEPVNGLPEQVTYTLQSERNVGRCEGTLNGSPVAFAPAHLFVEGPASIGCAGAFGVGAKGALTFTGGTLTPVDDVQVPVAVDLKGTVTEWDLTLRGTRSGVATAHLTYLESVDQEDAQRCLPSDPNGFSALRFGMRLDTASELVGEGAEVPLKAVLSAGKQRAPAVLRRGIAMRLATNAPVAGVLTATVGKTVVARRRVRNDAVSGGTVRLRLPLSRAGRRIVRSGRARTVVVTATVRHSSGKSATAVRTLRLGGGR